MSDTLTPTEAVAPTQAASAPEAPAFSASYDRESLLSNAPEGVDKDKFGKYLDKTADPFVAFKNYSNLEGMKSKGLPNESWTEADHAALNNALGIPSDKDGYQFDEAITLDEDSSAFIKNFAAENGLKPAQAQKAAELLQSVRAQEVEAKQLQTDKATENMISYLSDEWGHPDTVSYDNNFRLVKGVLEMEGIEHDSDVSNAIWSGPPQIIKMLNEYGKMLDSTIVSSFGGGDTTTPNTLQGQMDKIVHDMNHSERGSAAYKDLDAAFDRLHAQKSRLER